VSRRDAVGDEVVVVPEAPGPLRVVPGARSPDEVDALLDELFGPDDEGGPGVADAVLATGGGGAVVAGAVVGSTGLLGVGLAAVLLGSVLPARSLWRQAQRRRLTARREEALGAGLPLRVSPGPVADLVAAHRALSTVVTAAPDAVGAEERAAAHAAIADVAAVLGGGTPHDDEERAFVAERAEALAALVAGVEADAAAVRHDDLERRRARLAARHEVDRIEGASSADRLRQLAADRRPEADGG
jgi:hypothetical protein